MQETFAHFVRALRNAGVAVSPAETLDALEVLSSIGWSDRRRTKGALALAMAKSVDEKRLFDDCFERFFSVLRFTPKRIEPAETTDDLPAIASTLLRGDEDALALAVVAAAHRVHLDRIHFLREKSRYARALLGELGLPAFDSWLEAARASEDGRAALAARARAYLVDAVNAYVDEQYRIHVDATGRRAVVEAALAARLAEIPKDYYAELHEVVVTLAEKLIRRHKRTRRKAQRGQLDLRHTLRHNVAFDGVPFDLRWRQIRRKPPRIYVICDVSGSMAAVTRFFLLLVHELQAVLPRIRSFVFSNELAEVTPLFAGRSKEKAIEEALLHWGSGVTDYGRALGRFRELCHEELDPRATVIVLGDGRCNYLAPRPDVLADIAQRARHLLWLNPEARATWGEGDSEMRRYAPYCTRVLKVSTLRDLERFGDHLLTLI